MLNSRSFQTVLFGSLLLGLTLSSHAQEGAKPADAPRFTYVMPWDDATPGTITDLSALNAKPAGRNGRIVVRGRHFVESGTGQRIRFFGMNLSGATNFPSHDEATKLAAHLAKLGFNIVRIHHLDGNRSPLWDKTKPGHRFFDAQALDRLDFLVAALKKEGIYLNMNLHVSRTFMPEDGFPESVNKIGGSFNKRVDNYDRRMIELQKEFARNLLGHVNPYTGSNYIGDPAVAFVEINNENSLSYWKGHESRFQYFETLPEPFRSDLVALWNKWLKGQYRSDDAIRVAWKDGTEIRPTWPVSGADTKWAFQDIAGVGQLTPSQGVKAEAGPTALTDISVANEQKPKEQWQLQTQVLPLNFENGRTCAVSFRARADKSRLLPIYASVLEGDWHNIGLNVKVPLTTEWQEFRYQFRAEKVEAKKNRVVFLTGNDTGRVWLSDVRITAAGDLGPLLESQTLAAGTVPIPSGGTEKARADWLRFLAETERAYTDEMLEFLRQDLKVKSCLTNSQMMYGELVSFYREANSDFIDEHAYWQHPKFPTERWDSGNWKIEHASMVSALAEGWADTLARVATHRVAGKPYSVSEYCVPAPNDFQAEMYPLIASYAALQDWDAFYHFDYGEYGDGKPQGRIQSFFSLNGNPLKESFTAASALLFRSGQMAPLSRSTTLQLAKSAPFANRSIEEEWVGANGGKRPDLLSAQFYVAPNFPKDSSELQQRGGAASSTSSTVKVIKTRSGAQYIAQGQGAVTVAGFVGETQVTTLWATFDFPKFGNNYAALILTSASNKSAVESDRLLLTIGGKAENADIVWNADRTTVGNKWGNGPAQVEGIPATVTITNKRVKRAYALSPIRTRVKEIPLQRKGNVVSFRIGPEHQTLNYELCP